MWWRTLLNLVGSQAIDQLVPSKVASPRNWLPAVPRGPSRYADTLSTPTPNSGRVRVSYATPKIVPFLLDTIRSLVVGEMTLRTSPLEAAAGAFVTVPPAAPETETGTCLAHAPLSGVCATIVRF